MKRFIGLLLALLTLFTFASCKNEHEDTQSVSKEESKVDVEIFKEPVLTTGAGKISFKEDFINAENIEKDGFYLYTCGFLGSVTPQSDSERIDFTVADGYVAKVWEVNSQSFIPEQNGFTVVCVGSEAISYAQKLEAGYEVKTTDINTSILSSYYALVGDVVVTVDIIDGIRTPAGVCAIYTPEYGKTTGTNIYGAEITVVDGAVTKVITGAGNSEIPENGYVISIHKDHKAYHSARKAVIGTKVELFPNGPSYSVTSLSYDGVNSVRGENQLVVYMNQASTNTNAYGYEFSVNGEGKSVSESYKGNIAIPQNGFVVSAHGNAVKALADAYTRGQSVILDKTNHKVIIINTPDLCINTAKDTLDNLINSFNQAKKAYLNIAYSDISSAAENLKAEIEKAETMVSRGDMASAIEICSKVVSQAELLTYATIESKGAQNRAMWYRAYEKSDAEVRDTVEKLASLNVNALYLETFYDGYFIGYMDLDGVEHNPDNGEYDALEGFVRICHEYGIEVHAWCENFFAGYLNKDGTLSSPVLNKFSDKLLMDSEGNEFYYYNEKATFVFLNPNDTQCRKFVLNVYREILENYDIDGLHLDYIRFPELNYGKYDYGYNADIIKAFSKETGIKEDPRTFTKGSDEMKKWISFRCGIINSFVKEVFNLIHKEFPQTWLSCAVYPDREYAVNSIFQDVKMWVNNGWIDEVFSMTYSGENSFVSQNAAEYKEICKGNCFYSTGLAAFMDTSKLNFAYQLTEVVSAGADGVAIFALSNISPDTYQHQIIDGAFRNPSVQLYHCGDTVKAQLDYIKAMLEQSDTLFGSLSEAGKQSILDAMESLYANASVPEEILDKMAYCTQTKTSLSGLKLTVKNAFSDPEEAKAVNDELDELIYWLDLTNTRLNAKKPSLW